MSGYDYFIHANIKLNRYKNYRINLLGTTTITVAVIIAQKKTCVAGVYHPIMKCNIEQLPAEQYSGSYKAN